MLRAFTPPGGGGGGGTVTGTGTPGKLAKFATASSIGDSLLSESGTTITSAATAQTFTNNQAWTIPVTTVGLAINGSKFVFDGNGLLGINIPSTPSTCLHVADGAGTGFAGSVYEGVRLQRATEALFSSSDGTRSFRAGITGATAVVGTSTAHDLLLQRNNVTAATLQSGAIASVTLTAGGTGYTNGTYSQQALTGGTGTGATADIVVAGGIVTICVLRSPGTGYTAADALSCATIGAGAGFVVTVATIAQIVAGSGNVTALGRIGAGKSLPTAVVDALGSIVSSASEMRTAGGVMAYGAFFSDSSSEPGGVTTLSSNSSRGVAFTDTRQLDSSARSAAGLRGFEIAPTVQNVGSGTTTFYSASLTPTIQGASIAARTMVIRSINAQPFIGTLGAGNTVSTFDGFYGGLNCSSTSVVAFTTVSEFRSQTLYGGAAHTVGTHYQARFQAPILNDGSTITNRWGISQEDALANNYFAGNVGAGTASPTANLQVTQGTSGVGTVSNSAAGTTVTGSSTQFLNTFKIGDTITIGGQTVAITAIASNISMTTAAITSANSGVGYTLVGGTRFSALGNGNVSISTGALTVRTVANPNSYAIVAQDDIAIYTGTDATGTTSLRLGSSTSMPQGAALIKATKTAAGAATLTFQTAAGGALADQAKIDSAGVFSFNSGFGSLSTAYGCRAWVNFNGTTTITIRASGGISSITRTSAGVYVTNLSVTMPDANYSAIATKQNVASNVSCGLYDMLASRTTTAATWTCVEAALVQDAANINIAFFR